VTTVAQSVGVVRDGPAPIPAPYSIVQTLGQFGGLVTDEPDDHWMNGVLIDGQLCGDVSQEPFFCSSGVVAEDKDAGSYPASSAWESFTLYAPITCSSLGQFDGARLKQRAAAYLQAAAPAGIERVIEQGIGQNKYLNDADADDLTSGGSVDIVTAMSRLEAHAGIATFGKGGAIIHAAPALGPLLTSSYLAVQKNNGLVSLSSGYPIIVGQGYNGDAGSPATELKLYISGQMQLRRSEVFMTPDDPAWALDRENNVYEFRAEMIANVLFDTCLQAFATVDLTKTIDA
jgi:hypothetical protein